MKRIRTISACEMGAEPTGRQGPFQADSRAWLARALPIAVLAGALAGCSGVPATVHRIEGGQIAKPLQPPPGLAQPYPNLASVPARPVAPDQKALASISQELVADRENARHLTVAAPTPDPSLPAASPALFGVGTLPPPAPGGAAATLAAVQGPAPGASAAAPATPGPATARPATAPAPAPAPAPGAPPAETPAGAEPVIPAGPPAPPLGGIGAPVPATTPQAAPPTTPAPAPAPQSVKQAAPPPANPAMTVEVAFPPASAVLPAVSADALHALARRRGAHGITVIGHGDAASTDPDIQSQAVALALGRAQAIAQALAAAGVPESAVRLDAEASGRGGSARIME